MKFKFKINNKNYDIYVELIDDKTFHLYINSAYFVRFFNIKDENYNSWFPSDKNYFKETFDLNIDDIEYFIKKIIKHKLFL